MQNIIKASDRYHNDIGWLNTYHLFSFAEYIDYSNMGWGSLRVFNDDIILPKSGFPMHPHSNMEIVTIMLDGILTHTDSMGNREQIDNNFIQITSAGDGMFHSEMNEGDQKVHLYQIWLQPTKKGGNPTYNDIRIDKTKYKNNIYPIVSGEGKSDNTINSETTIYIANFDKEFLTSFNTKKDRYTFIYIYKGKLSINGKTLGINDQFRSTDLEKIDIEAIDDCEFILIDSY